ncbi:uncharacterized protein PHACADRAFT_188343 [Phanerochaete carnosa HHB-10118-sp]|uniref:Large ribosomal subunit protein mL44 n=1 Tax=Phanerochaete carnosa (strain HHB-10118-sp) TaxID=650164 RepID=K5UK45_PHACS|nr:uncharacterized protein PHACADRAFT_188343 [Phanerochaete carnosa HHB-10118-sp]EKM49961.1 hypothetical protein PHACADRAFT_188343 [Phanerochaete carnosa HHB-10118-sp]
MSHVQRRLASTAARLATVSASHLKAFPPKEAVVLKPSSSKAKTEHTPNFFDAETWASLQPPNPATLSAFAHRIGLGRVLANPVEAVQQAGTHPSFLSLYARHHPTEPAPATNANLASLGNSLLGLFATEHVNSTFPHLPTRVMKAAVSAYVGPTTCANIAKEMGAGQILRWKRIPNTPTRPAVLHADAISSVPRALTALVYQNHGLLSARRFVQRFFLSREVDLRNMIKFRDPKVALQETVAKFGRERPISRLLRETGRLSNSPVFVVGIYSGTDQLGEGFGSSLKMAEYRAAEDALLRLYLTRQPPNLVQLPTSTFPDARGDVFSAEGSAVSYIPVAMTDTEIKYGSADRTGMRTPRPRDSLEDDVD